MGEFDSKPQQLYFQDEAASPLACLESYEICTPGLPEGQRCTPPSGFSDLWQFTAALLKDREAINRLHWFLRVWSADMSTLYAMFPYLGAESLASRHLKIANVQGAGAENQWQVDVQHWLKIMLAYSQNLFVRTVDWPADPDPISKLRASPSDAQAEENCQSQVRISFPR
jgi:hypothetical protein